MNAIQHTIALPPNEVVVDRAVGRKILRDIAPLATSTQTVHDPVDDLAHVCPALAPAGLGRWNQRFNILPLLVREVARVPQMISIVSRPVLKRPHQQPRPPNHSSSFESQMTQSNQEVLKRTLSLPDSTYTDGAASLHTTNSPGRNTRRAAMRRRAVALSNPLSRLAAVTLTGASILVAP